MLCGIVAGSLAGRPDAARPPLLAADPLYLRRPDAREPGPPKRTTQYQPGGTTLLSPGGRPPQTPPAGGTHPPGPPLDPPARA